MAPGTRGSPAASANHFRTSPESSAATATRFSRIKEKNTLADLNDCLADCIEKNRLLERELQIKTELTKHHEDNEKRAVKAIKSVYKKEIQELKKKADRNLEEASRLKKECGTMKEKSEVMKFKIDSTGKELQTAKDALEKVDRKKLDIQHALHVVTAECDKQAAEGKNRQEENNFLTLEKSNLKQIIEQECRGKKHATTQLRKLDDEPQVSQKLHELKLKEVQRKRHLQHQKVDDGLKKEYEAKWQQSCQELRAEHEAQLRAVMEDKKNQCGEVYDHLKMQLERTQGLVKGRTGRIKTLQTELNAQMQIASKWDQERAEFQQQIQELLNQDDIKQPIVLAERKSLLRKKDDALNKLRNEIQALGTKYKALVDSNVVLDEELGTYKKLVRKEKRRLKRHFPD